MTTSVESLPRTATVPSPPSRPRRPWLTVLRRLPVYLAVTLLLAVVVLPLVWLLLGSFKTQAEFQLNPTWALPGSFTNIDNYLAAWAAMSVYLRNSVVAVFPSLILTVLLGTAAGFALEVLVWKGRRTTLLLFLAGIMIPGQMILLPLFSMYFKASLTQTLWPLVITYTATGLPLTVFMMATYFRSVPREVFEAATIDGATVLRQFLSVGLPMVRNSVFTIALVQFFFMWNDLLIALTFTTDEKLWTVQVGLLNFTGRFGVVDYGPTFAGICINMGLVLGLYVFLNQQVMKGMTAGAVKG